MTNRDLVHMLDAAPGLAPAVRNATATGSAVDLRGFDSATVLVHVGTWTDGSHTPSLEVSADGVSFGPAAAGDLQGSFAAVSGAGGANMVQAVGYAGPARYLRAKLTVAGASTGAAVGIAILRGHPARAGV